MNRSTWTAVFWTVVVLFAATMSTYLPWSQMAPPVARDASITWNARAARARAWLDERRFVLLLQYGDRVRVPALPWPLVAGAAFGMIALAGAGVAFARQARRRRPRVLRMAGHGETPAEIARRTGLPQDAVRLMLSPMLRSYRPGPRTGNSFRPRAETAAGAWRNPRRRASAT